MHPSFSRQRRRQDRARTACAVAAIETLEARQLLAVLVNFQPQGAPLAAGYVDSGEGFGPRADGLSYGWNAPNVTAAFPDHDEADHDPRLETSVVADPQDTWRIEGLAPDVYHVRLVMGSPTTFGGSFHARVGTTRTIISSAQAHGPGTPFVEGTIILDTTGTTGFTITTSSGGNFAYLQIIPQGELAAALAPSGLTATRTAISGAPAIDLRWTDQTPVDSDAAESSFTLQRRVVGSADWSNVANLPSNRTRHTDTGVVSGTAYEYRIFATNVHGVTAPSATASATASAAPGSYTTFAADIPGVIQAENYDIGGDVDTTTGNLAGRYRGGNVDIFRGEDRQGYAVGATAANERLEYAVTLREEGRYLLEAHVASKGDGGTFRVDAIMPTQTLTLARFTITDTGSDYLYRTLAQPLSSLQYFEYGIYKLRVVFETNGPGGTPAGRVDWLRFTKGPVAPEEIKALPTGDTQTTVTWSHNGDRVRGFRVQQSPSSTFNQITAEVEVGALEKRAIFNDTTHFTPAEQPAFYYRVIALGGWSPAANQLPDSNPSASAQERIIFVSASASNDEAALEEAIDRHGNEHVLIVLEPGATYVLDKRVDIKHPVSIEGRGAKLLLMPVAPFENTHLWFESKKSDQIDTWEQVLGAGAYELDLEDADVPSYRKGDVVYVELGDDPFDAEPVPQPGDELWDHVNWIPHHNAITTIRSDPQNGMIQIDEPTPYPIETGDGTVLDVPEWPYLNPDGTPALDEQGNPIMVEPNQPRPHRIRKITSLIENIYVNNLEFGHDPAAIPIGQIALWQVRNATVQNITGTFTIAVGAGYSDNVTVRNVTGTLVSLYGAANRVIGSQGSDNTSLDGANVITADVNPVVFAENWDRGLHVKDLTVNWQAQGGHNPAVFYLTNGTHGAYIESVRVNNTGGPVDLIFDDSQSIAAPAQYRFGTVQIVGPVSTVPLPGRDLTDAWFDRTPNEPDIIFFDEQDSLDTLILGDCAVAGGCEYFHAWGGQDGPDDDGNVHHYLKQVVAATYDLVPDANGMFNLSHQQLFGTSNGVVVGRASFRIYSDTGVTDAEINAALNTGDQRLSFSNNNGYRLGLTAGVTARDYSMGSGGHWKFNDRSNLSTLTKFLRGFIGDDFPEGVKLEVTIEYWIV